MVEHDWIDMNDGQALSEVLNIALRNKPVGDLRQKLEHPDRGPRMEAFKNVAALAAMNNAD